MKRLLLSLLFVANLAAAQGDSSTGQDKNAYLDHVYIPVSTEVQVDRDTLSDQDIPISRLRCPSTKTCYVSIKACEESILLEQNSEFTLLFNNAANVKVLLMGDKTKKTFRTRKACLVELEKSSKTKRDK